MYVFSLFWEQKKRDGKLFQFSFDSPGNGVSMPAGVNFQERILVMNDGQLSIVTVKVFLPSNRD